MDKTGKKDMSLQEFTVSIAGTWINPVTKNKYIFTPDPKDQSKGEVSIQQNGTETLVPLRINLTKDESGVHVMVENAVYPVTFSEGAQKTLIIDLQPAGIVRLIKLS